MNELLNTEYLIRLRKASGFFLDAELEKALYRLEERGLVESVNDDEYQITFRKAG